MCHGCCRSGPHTTELGPDSTQGQDPTLFLVWKKIAETIGTKAFTQAFYKETIQRNITLGPNGVQQNSALRVIRVTTYQYIY